MTKPNSFPIAEILPEMCARLGAQPGALDYVQGFRTAMWALTVVLLVCVALSAALGPMHRRVRAGA